MIKVLLVDDSKTMIFSYKGRLISAFRNQITFLTAENKEEADNIIENNVFDILITDWNLENYTGADIFRTCRKKFGNNFPCLIITAEPNEKINPIKDMFSKLDHNCKWLKKPVKKDILEREVKKIIKL